MVLGNVFDAKIMKAVLDRRKKRTGLDGLVLSFKTETNLKQDDLVKIMYDNGTKSLPKPFKVCEIEITSNNMLLVRCVETGYYARKTTTYKNFDIRNILGLEVIQVTDESEINKINEASCWC